LATEGTRESFLSLMFPTESVTRWKTKWYPSWELKQCSEPSLYPFLHLFDDCLFSASFGWACRSLAVGTTNFQSKHLTLPIGDHHKLGFTLTHLSAAPMFLSWWSEAKLVNHESEGRCETVIRRLLQVLLIMRDSFYLNELTQMAICTSSGRVPWRIAKWIIPNWILGILQGDHSFEH